MVCLYGNVPRYVISVIDMCHCVTRFVADVLAQTFVDDSLNLVNIHHWRYCIASMTSRNEIGMLSEHKKFEDLVFCSLTTVILRHLIWLFGLFSWSHPLHHGMHRACNQARQPLNATDQICYFKNVQVKVPLTSSI